MRLKNKVSTKRLAEMWCELNSWQWPKELAAVKVPDPKNDRSNKGFAIMKTIELAIGSKPINEAWKRHCDKAEN